MKKLILLSLLLIATPALATTSSIDRNPGNVTTVTFPFGESITNPADGDMCFNGLLGTNNENICFDFESGFSNIMDLKSNTGVTTFRHLSMTDSWSADFGTSYGSGSNGFLGMVSTGNDSLQLSMILNGATASGYLTVVEGSARGNANRSPLAVTTNPTIRMYGAGSADPLDYGDIYQNGTDFNITTGSGALVFTPAGTETRVTGSLTVSSTIQGTSTGSLGWNKATAANQACNVTCTSAAVFGYDSGTNTIVSATDATADMCICAGTT